MNLKIFVKNKRITASTLYGMYLKIFVKNKWITASTLYGMYLKIFVKDKWIHSVSRSMFFRLRLCCWDVTRLSVIRLEEKQMLEVEYLHSV
jgi:hypothetical protein